MPADTWSPCTHGSRRESKSLFLPAHSRHCRSLNGAWHQVFPLPTFSLNASSVMSFKLMSTLKYAPNTPVSRALAAT